MAHARRAKLAFVLTCAFVVVPADGALLPMAAQAAPLGATSPVAVLQFFNTSAFVCGNALFVWQTIGGLQWNAVRACGPTGWPQ